ncbi:hypothetical protein LR48_Vigan306s001000 [Vigna angularis]|uniref:Uncharacterized protein n=1 Tax=Phaseolus angularis TaxID=3914 RepID=A0A0L9T805_PHAAN|nr:hypothetical protein LR48_Vigan306s001000 [Vigna angularis]
MPPFTITPPPIHPSIHNHFLSHSNSHSHSPPPAQSTHELLQPLHYKIPTIV